MNQAIQNILQVHSPNLLMTTFKYQRSQNISMSTPYYGSSKDGDGVGPMHFAAEDDEALNEICIRHLGDSLEGALEDSAGAYMGRSWRMLSPRLGAEMLIEANATDDIEPIFESRLKMTVAEALRDTSGVFTSIRGGKWLSPKVIAEMILDLKELSESDFTDLETNCDRCEQIWEWCDCYCEEHEMEYGYCVWDHEAMAYEVHAESMRGEWAAPLAADKSRAITDVKSTFRWQYPSWEYDETKMYLTYTQGASNKYHLFFTASLHSNGMYASFNAYGRIGSVQAIHNIKQGTKYEITHAMDKKIHQKMKKGYSETLDAESFSAEKVVSWICDECGNHYHTEDEAEKCRCKTADWKYNQQLLDGNPAPAGRTGWSDVQCSHCGDFMNLETEIVPEKCPSCNYWMNAESFSADGITMDDEGMRHSPHKECPDCGAKPTSSWIDPGKCECGRVMNPSQYTNISFSADFRTITREGVRLEVFDEGDGDRGYVAYIEDAGHIFSNEEGYVAFGINFRKGWGGYPSKYYISWYYLGIDGKDEIGPHNLKILSWNRLDEAVKWLKNNHTRIMEQPDGLYGAESFSAEQGKYQCRKNGKQYKRVKYVKYTGYEGRRNLDGSYSDYTSAQCYGCGGDCNTPWKSHHPHSLVAESFSADFRYSGGASGKCALCAKQIVAGSHTTYVPNNYPICGECYWARFDDEEVCLSCGPYAVEIYPCLKCGTYEQSPYVAGCECLNYFELTSDEWNEMADNSLIECGMCGVDISMKDSGPDEYPYDVFAESGNFSDILEETDELREEMDEETTISAPFDEIETDHDIAEEEEDPEWVTDSLDIMGPEDFDEGEEELDELEKYVKLRYGQVIELPPPEGEEPRVPLEPILEEEDIPQVIIRLSSRDIETLLQLFEDAALFGTMSLVEAHTTAERMGYSHEDIEYAESMVLGAEQTVFGAEETYEGEVQEWWDALSNLERRIFFDTWHNYAEDDVRMSGYRPLHTLSTSEQIQMAKDHSFMIEKSGGIWGAEETVVFNSPLDRVLKNWR